MNEDVCELKVPMHNLLLVDLFEAINKLLKNDASFELLELASQVLQFLKITSIAILHDQVEVIFCTLHIL